MEGGLVILAIIGVAALIIWAVAASIKAAAKRREELFLLAQNWGFQYLPDGLSEQWEGSFWENLVGSGPGSPTVRFLQNLNGFRPFGEGEDWRIENLIYGRSNERDLYAFDYSFVTESTTTDSDGHTRTTRTTHHRGVILFRVQLYLPGLAIGRESFFSAIGRVFGVRDIEFESDEFNKRFRVMCENRQAAFDILHPQMMEYMMSLPDLDIQAGGPFVMVHSSRLYSASEISGVVVAINGFLDRIPEYFKQDRGFSARWDSPMDGMGGN